MSAASHATVPRTGPGDGFLINRATVWRREALHRQTRGPHLFRADGGTMARLGLNSESARRSRAAEEI